MFSHKNLLANVTKMNEHLIVTTFVRVLLRKGNAIIYTVLPNAHEGMNMFNDYKVITFNHIVATKL